MFMGEYTHALDAKGRLTIPTRLRAELGAAAVLTRGYEPYLLLYPLDEWTALTNKLRGLATTNAAVRSYNRLIFGGAFPAEPDRLGRILIPAFLREYAKIDLEQEVTVVGVNGCIELWSSQLFRQKLSNDQQDMVQTLAQLAQLGV